MAWNDKIAGYGLGRIFSPGNALGVGRDQAMQAQQQRLMQMQQQQMQQRPTIPPNMGRMGMTPRRPVGQGMTKQAYMQMRRPQNPAPRGPAPGRGLSMNTPGRSYSETVRSGNGGIAGGYGMPNSSTSNQLPMRNPAMSFDPSAGPTGGMNGGGIIGPTYRR